MIKKIVDPVSPTQFNPKHASGLSKVPLHLVPPVAIIYEAMVFKFGAKEYGPFNWRDTAVVRSIYLDAVERHLLAMRDGQDIDPKSGLPHAAHIRASMAIILDAAEIGNLIDDRGPDGTAAALMERFAENIQK